MVVRHVISTELINWSRKEMKRATTSAYHSALLEGLRIAYERHSEVIKELEKFPSDVQEIAKLEQIELRKLVGLRVELSAQRSGIILFASSFLEALINHWMVTSLPKDDFKALEKLSPLEKWTIGPKLIHRDYELPKGEPPHQYIVELYKRRNNIVHHVPFHSVNEEIIHSGKFPPVAQNENHLMERFFNLPSDLMHHLIDNGFGSDAFSLIFCSGMNVGDFIDKLNSKKKREPVKVSNG